MEKRQGIAGEEALSEGGSAPGAAVGGAAVWRRERKLFPDGRANRAGRKRPRLPACGNRARFVSRTYNFRLFFGY